MPIKILKITKMNSYRKIRISTVKEAPWGTHFFQFYKTKEDLLETLIPYFESGLVGNEMYVLVTSDFLTKEEAIRYKIYEKSRA